jgi:hypothetical protein
MKNIHFQIRIILLETRVWHFRIIYDFKLV